MLRRRWFRPRRHIYLSALYPSFAEKDAFCKKLESIFAGLLKNNPAKIYSERNNLLYVAELNRTLLLE